MELKKHSKYLYNSGLLKKFIANLAKGGKIQKFETSLFIALRNLKFKINLNPLILFLYILNEIKPCIELKSLRLGSVTYKIPVPLLLRKQLFRSVKLLCFSVQSNKQSGPLWKKIQQEFFLILQKKSLLYKTNRLLYQTASNNRAFAHYR
jgi:ribosomal protein S7